MSGPGLTVPTWVCLGDSLTHEPPSSPTTILEAWPGRIDQAIYPGRAAANHGHTGTQVTVDNVDGVSMLNHFNNDIDGKGYYGMVFWGGINDFLFGVTAATLFPVWLGIVNRALAQGMKVIAIITHSPAGYTGGWTGTQQGYLDSFKASVLALQGTNPNLTIVNFYQAAPAGLDDPTAPTFLYGPYAGVANDGLHYGQLAQDQVILPTLIPLMQAAAPAPTPEPIDVFGVDADSVRKAHFPNWTPFSSSTNPTVDTIDSFILEEGADLAGALRVKSIDPTSITDSTSEAFAWCAKTLKLMVAVRIYPAVTAGNPDGLKALQAQLDARLAWLEKHGLELAGAQTLISGSEPEGPTSHISQYGLTTADSSLMSSTESPFHKDDQL
jgi:hypothetical protein